MNRLGNINDSITYNIAFNTICCFSFYDYLWKAFRKVWWQKLILVGIVTYALICCYGYFIKTAVDFWILAMLVGSAQGGIQAISRSYFAKLVPKEKSVEYFGFYSIFGKFAAVFSHS